MQFDLIGYIRDEMERVLGKAIVQEPDVTDAKLAVLVKLSKAIGYNPEVSVKLNEGDERIKEKLEHENNNQIEELKIQNRELRDDLIHEQNRNKKQSKKCKRKKKVVLGVVKNE